MGVNEVITTVTGFAPGEWSWTKVTLDNTSATLPLTQTGVYTISLWMREDGLRIDRLLLTTDTTYIPTGFDPAETERYVAGTAPPTLPLERTMVYTYDNLYRLTEANYTSGENYQYQYDEIGNRLKQIIDGDTTDYLYDDANRLEQLNGQQVYTFDANGNLLESNVLTNTFDAANRLVETSRSSTTLEPIYNGVNDRVAQVTDGVTTTFALDIAGGLPEVIYTSDDEAYLHLPGVIVTESSTGETRYLLADGLGSIRQVTDENGEIVAYNEFDPYGNPVQSGDEPYGFTGEWWADEVSLLHLRARWYAPKTGTFLSVDPVESEPPYQYVRGNVVNLVDPSGAIAIYKGDAQKLRKIVTSINNTWRLEANLVTSSLYPSGLVRFENQHIRIALPDRSNVNPTPGLYSGQFGVPRPGEIYQDRISLQGFANFKWNQQFVFAFNYANGNPRNHQLGRPAFPKEFQNLYVSPSGPIRYDRTGEVEQVPLSFGANPRFGYYHDHLPVAFQTNPQTTPPRRGSPRLPTVPQLTVPSSHYHYVNALARFATLLTAPPIGLRKYNVRLQERILPICDKGTSYDDRWRALINTYGLFLNRNRNTMDVHIYDLSVSPDNGVKENYVDTVSF